MISLIKNDYSKYIFLYNVKRIKNRVYGNEKIYISNRAGIKRKVIY